mgnify:CR=1 FL=1
MKEKLSSVFYMWVAFACGVLAVLFMFAPVMTNEYTTYVNATQLFWNDSIDYTPSVYGAWPSFVGYMLILVGAIASGVVALPIIQPSAKVEKIVLISSIACMVVGLVAVGLLQVIYSGFNSGVMFGIDRLTYLWGWYVTMSLGVIAVAMDCVALKLDW